MRALRHAIAPAVVVALAAAALTVAGAPANAVTSPWHNAGAGGGAIPDGSGDCDHGGSAAGSPLDITFNIAGVPTGTPLTGVRVGLSIEHPTVRDLTATLMGPGGDTEQVLFDHTGVTASHPAGSRADLEGSYTIGDLPAAAPIRDQDWWFEAEDDDLINPGRYRPTSSTGAAVGLTAAFSGLADPNGTWTLRVVDRCSGGSGGVVDAALLQVKTAYDDATTCMSEGMTRVSAETSLATATGAASTARAAELAAVDAAGEARGARTAAVRVESAASTADRAAARSVRSAKAALTKAAKALRRAQKSHQAAKVKRARAALQKANGVLASAQKEATATHAAAGVAHDAVVTATQTLTEAQADLATAQATAVGAESTLAAARDAARDAHQAEDFCLDS